MGGRGANLAGSGVSMELDWRSAYLLQAKSDYEMFTTLAQKEDTPLCHTLHYLQMATEKLAKSFLSEPNQPWPSRHQAYVAFIHVLLLNPNPFQKILGYTRKDQYKASLGSIRRTAKTLEDLVPESLRTRPNPEYPWSSQGRIYVPVVYDFPGLRLQEVGMRKLLKFTELSFVMVENLIKSTSI